MYLNRSTAALYIENCGWIDRRDFDDDSMRLARDFAGSAQSLRSAWQAELRSPAGSR